MLICSRVHFYQIKTVFVYFVREKNILTICTIIYLYLTEQLPRFEFKMAAAETRANTASSLRIEALVI